MDVYTTNRHDDDPVPIRTILLAVLIELFGADRAREILTGTASERADNDAWQRRDRRAS